MGPPAFRARFAGQLRALRLTVQGLAADRVPFVSEFWSRRDLRFMLGRYDYEVKRRLRSPDHLANFASSIWSQIGEDGMIAELFRRFGVDRGRFVEIGAADGEQNCTRALAESGWSGLWLDADGRACHTARLVAPESVTVIEAFVTGDNVVALLDTTTDAELDLVVIDVDSQDWRILRAVLERFGPKVVVVEYNGAYPPGHWWVLRSARATWDRTHRHGASLEALTWLANRHGYELVACDPLGVNAFYVRHDLVSLSRSAPCGTTTREYSVPWFTPHPLGHPRTASGLASMPPLTTADLARVRVVDARREQGRGSLRPNSAVAFSVVVDNGTDTALASGSPSPFSLSVRWLNSPSDNVDPVAPRMPLACAVPPGRSRRLFGWSITPGTPGHYQLRITAVQEGVAWLEQVSNSGSDDLAVVVS